MAGRFGHDEFGGSREAHLTAAIRAGLAHLTLVTGFKDVTPASTAGGMPEIDILLRGDV